MKYLLPFLILILSSCVQSQSIEKDTRITELEKQIQELKIENANLKENQALINAGGMPSEIQSTQLSGGTTIINPLFPEGTTFEETDSTECMRKAYNDYITAGTKECRTLGYTEEEIKIDKCQLSTIFINQLKTKKTNDEGKCGPQ